MDTGIVHPTVWLFTPKLLLLHTAPTRDVNKDSSLKAQARTKDWRFKAKDQGPRPRTTSLA